MTWLRNRQWLHVWCLWSSVVCEELGGLGIVAPDKKGIPQGLKPRSIASERDPRLKPWDT
jgi:hypothetical protein